MRGYERNRDDNLKRLARIEERPEVCRGCSPGEYGIDELTQVKPMSAALCMIRLKLGWTNRNWIDRGLVPALSAA